MVRNRKETTEKSKKKPGLSTQIFIALLAGALLGVVIHYWIPSSYIKDTVIVEGVLYVIGQGFIRLSSAPSSAEVCPSETAKPSERSA